MTDPLAAWANHGYQLAVKAGQEIMRFYAEVKTLVPEYKEDSSPLTAADKAAHKIIYEGLINYHLTQDRSAPVLSEEGEMIPYLTRQQWGSYWCIDPLDGTREFLAQSKEFAVNIALIKDHKPIIGIIYIPAKKQGYMAWSGGGAYLCRENGDLERIFTKKPPDHPLRVMLSRHCTRSMVQPWASLLGEITIIHLGSSLKFAELASGGADILLRLSPTSEWDNAAGHCLLEEAGGAIFTFDGQPLVYNRSGTIEQGHFIAVGDRSINWGKYFGF